MIKTYDYGEYRFECDDVDANTWVGIRVYKNGFELPFKGFDGKGESAFKIRCVEIYQELTGKKR